MHNMHLQQQQSLKWHKNKYPLYVYAKEAQMELSATATPLAWAAWAQREGILLIYNIDA